MKISFCCVCTFACLYVYTSSPPWHSAVVASELSLVNSNIKLTSLILPRLNLFISLPVASSLKKKKKEKPVWLTTIGHAKPIGNILRVRQRVCTGNDSNGLRELRRDVAHARKANFQRSPHRWVQKMQVVDQQQTNWLEDFPCFPTTGKKVPFVRSWNHNVRLLQELQNEKQHYTTHNISYGNYTNKKKIMKLFYFLNGR